MTAAIAPLAISGRGGGLHMRLIVGVAIAVVALTACAKRETAQPEVPKLSVTLVAPRLQKIILPKRDWNDDEASAKLNEMYSFDEMQAGYTCQIEGTLTVANPTAHAMLVSRTLNRIQLRELPGQFNDPLGMSASYTGSDLLLDNDLRVPPHHHGAVHASSPLPLQFCGMLAKTPNVTAFFAVTLNTQDEVTKLSHDTSVAYRVPVKVPVMEVVAGPGPNLPTLKRYTADMLSVRVQARSSPSNQFVSGFFLYFKELYRGPDGQPLPPGSEGQLLPPLYARLQYGGTTPQPRYRSYQPITDGRAFPTRSVTCTQDKFEETNMEICDTALGPNDLQAMHALATAHRAVVQLNGSTRTERILTLEEQQAISAMLAEYEQRTKN